jgi:Uma2 family endonuclease
MTLVFAMCEYQVRIETMPALLISVEEYLATSFEDGDREYVDGVLEEKSVGEVDHSDVQGIIYSCFLVRRKQFGLHPLVEVRTQVSPTRYRVPDITLVRGGKPATRVDEYLLFGVSYAWVIDPHTGNGHIYTAERRIAVEDGKFRTTDPAIEMDFAELFAD